MSFDSIEGTYTKAAQTNLQHGFNPEKPTRFSIANLQLGANVLSLIIFNLDDTIFILDESKQHQSPYRQLQFGSSSEVRSNFPTSHKCKAQSEDQLLVVGLQSGEVFVVNIRQQLQPKQDAPYIVWSCTGEAAERRGKCVAVDWVNDTANSQFAVLHATGTLAVYAVGPDDRSLGGNSPPLMLFNLTGVQVSDMAVAPNGSYVAITAKDGVLRIYSFPGASLLGGFKSFYGGLLCCSWSVDSEFVATGGEDDLLSVYGIRDGCVVAWGEGHSSYISQVRFDAIQERTNQMLNRRLAQLHYLHTHPPAPAADPDAPNDSLGNGSGASEMLGYPIEGQQQYRIVTVGQDCQMAFWDMVITDPVEQPWLAAKTPNRVGSSTTPLYMLDQASGPPSAEAVSGSATHRSVEKQSSSPTVRKAKKSSGAVAPEALQISGKQVASSSSLQDMQHYLMHPISKQPVHSEPLSDVAFTDQFLYTACYGGQVKQWSRPDPEAILKKEKARLLPK